MYIEANLLRSRRPSLITEAVDMFAVGFGVKAVIAGGNGCLPYQIFARRIKNLEDRDEWSALVLEREATSSHEP